MKFIEFPKKQARKKNSLDSFVFSSRVRIARNIEGLKFPLLLNESEKSALEEKICREVRNLPYSMEVENIDEMERERVMVYLSNHVMTQEFLKRGKIFVYDAKGDWVLLLNEDDHIKAFSIEEGCNTKSMYTRLSRLVGEIEERVGFAFDEKYGYLTSSILNVGTGLRLSFLVNLFGMVATKKIELFVEAAGKMGYSVLSFSEGSDSGLFFLYNIYSLGISEEAMIKEQEEFLNHVYSFEIEAREEYFSKKEDLELSFEEIWEMRHKEKVDFQNTLYYISLLDALNKKHVLVDDISKLRNMVYSSSDDYLHFRNHIEKEALDSARMNLLKNACSFMKYKRVEV
jgi:protein arginine kinase